MKRVKKWQTRVLSSVLVLLLVFSVITPGNTVFAESEEPGQQEAVTEIQEQTKTEPPETQEQINTEPSKTQEQINTEPSKAQGQINTEPPEKEQSEEFDAAMPFTLAALENVDSYSMDIDDGIPIKNFELEAENEDKDVSTNCTLDFPTGLRSIPGGLVEAKVPAVVNNQHGVAHAYSYAHVGNTKIYYMGNLQIHNDGKTEDYIFYTTDKQIDKRTVYVILKPEEKIKLVYKHGTYYGIDYQFQDMNGNKLPEDPENGLTYDKVFGEHRVRSLGEGESLGATVEIPRGYTATVLVKKEGITEPVYKSSDLGKMMEFYKSGHQLYLKDGCPKPMKFRNVISIDNIRTNMTVIVQYKRVESISFKAYLWTTTQFASGRVLVKNASGGYENPAERNSNLSTNGHSFTWEFDGITSDGITWEMNQFEINDERILFPMTSLTETNEKTAITTLSTGTKVTLKVQSLGGANGKGGRRHYTLQIDNCYEDVTVSGGNMVGHSHREFALHRLEGTADSEYYQSISSAGWAAMEQDTLIDKRNNGYNIQDPLRFKLAIGYQQMHVSFTTKEGMELQKDANSKDTSTYIEYLNRNDIGNTGNKNVRGAYTVVSYADWKPSADGYYYCRGTASLDRFMRSENKYGVVLVNIYADPVKNAIDYQNGAGDSTSAPPKEHIKYMPQYQNGGEDGYNIRNNPVALVSNTIPIDEDEKFIFDHWEILLVKNGKPGTEVLKDSAGNPYKVLPGSDINVSEDSMKELAECVYYNAEQKRNTLTLRAVWKERGINDPIPYTVNYYITTLEKGEKYSQTLIEEHQHTVNKGATLVSDLWQDANKTLSPVIQEVLGGSNDHNKDYTEKNAVKWVIWEKETTKRIDSVDETHNTANIYLVKQPNLTISKTVTGQFGDRTKQFTFTVTAKDHNNVPLNGTYTYKGGVLTGTSGVTAPTETEVEFKDGTATISLSHGQTITFTNLPVACHYTVTESDAAGYDPSYDGTKGKSVSGILDADTTISVVNDKIDVAVTGVRERNRIFMMLSGIGLAAILLMLSLEVWRRRKKV